MRVSTSVVIDRDAYLDTNAYAWSGSITVTTAGSSYGNGATVDLRFDETEHLDSFITRLQELSVQFKVEKAKKEIENTVREELGVEA